MEKLISDVKDLLLSPLQLFERIRSEETTQSEITKSLLVYVAVIPAIAGFFGRVIIGYNVPFIGYSHVSFFSGLAWAVLLFILAIVGIYAVSFVVSSLTVHFGGSKSDLNAFKLTTYSFIPVLTLGVFSLIPALSGLYILGLYGIYLFYIGLPVLLQVPEDRALTFTVIMSLVSIVITILFYRIAGLAIVTSMP